ncbi:MAG: hypothetical protein COX32_02235 [Candidatus Moranbacteria bacterium CG23_combo_of_CG06-09_8_20_14_all_41_28]|nr:MAG: hypothetical protein COX32_02235 [Candidatus Moranbacteria bacterium CG23_combo_of_CG06-09_8_20_14_all_41_28]
MELLARPLFIRDEAVEHNKYLEKIASTISANASKANGMYDDLKGKAPSFALGTLVGAGSLAAIRKFKGRNLGAIRETISKYELRKS